MSSNLRLAWFLILVTAGATAPAFAGPGVWTSVGPFGGDVTAMAVDPSRPSIVFAATIYQNNPALPDPPRMFRSLDGGRTWEWLASFDQEHSPILAIAIDPVDGDRVFAGGFYLHESVDGGSRWAQVGLIDPASLEFLAGVQSILFPPGNSPDLFVVAQDQVFRSVDVGATFQISGQGIPNSEQCSGLAPRLDSPLIVGDSKIPGTLYTTACGLFKTTDGGATWFSLAGDLPSQDVETIATDPSRAATLYVSTDSHGVLKSTSGGLSWDSASNGLSGDSGLVFIDALLVDPANSANIFAAADLGVYRTSDAGQSWEATDDGLRSNGSGRPARATTLAETVGNILVGSVSGVALGVREANSWVWSPSNSGLRGIGFEALAESPTDPLLVYGSSLGAGLFVSTNGGSAWSPAPSPPGEIAGVSIDPQNPGVLFCATQDFQGFRGYDYSTYLTTDGGLSWAPYQSGPFNAPSYLPIFDPRDPSILFFLDRPYFYRSTDRGETWSTRYTEAVALALDSANPSTVLALGYFTGYPALSVAKSTDLGATWATVQGRPDTGTGPGFIAASGTHLYVAQGPLDTSKAAQVAVSENGGESWKTSIIGPPGYPSALVALPRFGIAFLAVNGGGIFVYRDDGEGWVSLSPAVPDPNVFALTVGSDGAMLHAATASGVYDLAISGITSPVTPVGTTGVSPVIGRGTDALATAGQIGTH